MFSIKFWNFSAIIFSKFFLPLSLSSSSGTPIMHMLVCLMMSHISLRLFGLPDLSWSVFCWFFLLWVQIYCRAPLSEVFILFIVHFHVISQPLIGWRLFLTPLSHWCLHPLLLDLCCVAWRLFSQFREFMSLSCVQPKTRGSDVPSPFASWASAQSSRASGQTMVFAGFSDISVKCLAGSIYYKPIGNIILSGEKLKPFL